MRGRGLAIQSWVLSGMGGLPGRADVFGEADRHDGGITSAKHIAYDLNQGCERRRNCQGVSAAVGMRSWARCQGASSGLAAVGCQV